ncbi:MAG: glycosyltransferase [Brevinematia bacterium]
MKRIRFMLSYPLCMDKGGGVTQSFEALKALEKLGYDVKPFDWYNEDIDFDILFIFGFTHFNPEVLEFLKSKGVKIICEPIFVRVKNYLYYKVLGNILFRLPFQNFLNTKKRILELCDYIFVNSEVERNEIANIFGISRDKIEVAYLGLPSYILENEDKVSEDLFYSKYKVRDFVFYPSARISVRKNQLSLVKALKGSGVKLVLTGCNDIEPELKEEFHKLVDGDNDILCLPVLDKETLISAYKNSKVLAFISLAETAGIVGLEGGYFGNNLVLSDIPVFKEYYDGYGSYVKPFDIVGIRKAIMDSLSRPRDYSIKDFILKNRTWEAHARLIDQTLERLYKNYV